MSRLHSRYRKSSIVFCENCGDILLVPAGVTGEFYCSPKCHDERRHGKRGVMKIKRVRNRLYEQTGGGRSLTSHAEYELVRDSERLAKIIRGPDGWRACRFSESSSFGLPISPVGMNLFREVKAWAIENLVD